MAAKRRRRRRLWRGEVGAGVLIAQDEVRDRAAATIGLLHHACHLGQHLGQPTLCVGVLRREHADQLLRRHRAARLSGEDLAHEVALDRRDGLELFGRDEARRAAALRWRPRRRPRRLQRRPLLRRPQTHDRLPLSSKHKLSVLGDGLDEELPFVLVGGREPRAQLRRWQLLLRLRQQQSAHGDGLNRQRVGRMLLAVVATTSLVE